MPTVGLGVVLATLVVLAWVPFAALLAMPGGSSPLATAASQLDPRNFLPGLIGTLRVAGPAWWVVPVAAAWALAHAATSWRAVLGWAAGASATASVAMAAVRFLAGDAAHVATEELYLQCLALSLAAAAVAGFLASVTSGPHAGVLAALLTSALCVAGFALVLRIWGGSIGSWQNLGNVLAEWVPMAGLVGLPVAGFGQGLPRERAGDRRLSRTLAAAVAVVGALSLFWSGVTIAAPAVTSTGQSAVLRSYLQRDLPRLMVLHDTAYRDAMALVRLPDAADRVSTTVLPGYEGILADADQVAELAHVAINARTAALHRAYLDVITAEDAAWRAWVLMARSGDEEAITVAERSFAAVAEQLERFRELRDEATAAIR